MKEDRLHGGGRWFIPLLTGIVVSALHLGAQVFSLLQTYRTGLAYFDEPASTQAAWESNFWEKVTAVTTFPMARIWEYFPHPARTKTAVEWFVLVVNSILWGLALALLLRKAGDFLGDDEEEG